MFVNSNFINDFILWVIFFIHIIIDLKQIKEKKRKKEPIAEQQKVIGTMNQKDRETNNINRITKAIDIASIVIKEEFLRATVYRCIHPK